jgi:hypothetical protein
MKFAKDQSFDASYARCVAQLDWALHQLNAKPGAAMLEDTASLIMQTMTGTWRSFHTPEHIFDVGRSGDAVEVLAALFHDAIHIQADNGVSVNVGLLMAPFIRERRGVLQIRDVKELPADPVFEMVCAIFDFTPGQSLQAHLGQNEFLSALVAAQCLQRVLPLSVLTEIVACIEATIPFRGPDAVAVLRSRLHQVVDSAGLGWDAAMLDLVLRRAVRLANRDVENFAHPSAAEFLNNTWNLMPETNHDLTAVRAYTVLGYRKSIHKMEDFMTRLTPVLVFQQYQDEPSDAAYAVMLERTAHNLEVARLYLRSKLLAIAMVEAVSLRIGQEVPLASMMGELPGNRSMHAQIEAFLPAMNSRGAPASPLEQEVLALLEQGRSQESDYDVRHSPVATFVVKSIGFERTMEQLVHARDYFDGRISSVEFLQGCDPEVLQIFVNAVCRVFESRLMALRNLPAHD